MLRSVEEFKEGFSPALLAEQLSALGLAEGDTVLVHTSLRAIGPIASGGEGLLQALQMAIGTSGTIMAPAFYGGSMDPAGWQDPPCPPEELEEKRANLAPGGPDSPIDEFVGIFPRIIQRQPGALRDAGLCFVALGQYAKELMSPLSIAERRMVDSFKGLSERNGWALYLGVDFKAATSVHCAEELMDLPYLLRDEPARFLMASGEWAENNYDWGCSDNFNVVATVLEERGQLKRGKVGNANALLARHNDIVSAATSLLEKNRGALLCSREDCVWCTRARRILEEEKK